MPSATCDTDGEIRAMLAAVMLQHIGAARRRHPYFCRDASRAGTAPESMSATDYDSC